MELVDKLPLELPHLLVVPRLLCRIRLFQDFFHALVPYEGRGRRIIPIFLLPPRSLCPAGAIRVKVLEETAKLHGVTHRDV